MSPNILDLALHKNVSLFLAESRSSLLCTHIKPVHINETGRAADAHPAVVGPPTSSSPSSTILLYSLPSFLLPPKNLLFRGLARNASVQTHRIKELGPGTLSKEQKFTICK